MQWQRTKTILIVLNINLEFRWIPKNWYKSCLILYLNILGNIQNAWVFYRVPKHILSVCIMIFALIYVRIWRVGTMVRALAVALAVAVRSLYMTNIYKSWQHRCFSWSGRLCLFIVCFQTLDTGENLTEGRACVLLRDAAWSVYYCIIIFYLKILFSCTITSAVLLSHNFVLYQHTLKRNDFIFIGSFITYIGSELHLIWISYW